MIPLERGSEPDSRSATRWRARYAVARAITAIVLASRTRQCVGVRPIALHITLASRTLYFGRRAGKLYSEVLIGTIASVTSSRPASSASSWIATANSYRLDSLQSRIPPSW